MKKPIVLLCAILSVLFAIPASAQWFQQNSTVGFNLLDVDFADTLHGVVTGIEVQHTDTGLVTTNGGINWIKTTKPGGFGPVSMVNALRGFSSAGNQFVTTTNGGFTWNNTGSIPFGIVWIEGQSYVDSLRGWATGSPGGKYYVIATTDGGYTWAKQCSVFGDLMDVMFVDSLYGWACGWYAPADSLVIATKDGGRTWVKQSTRRPGGFGPAYAVFALDSLRGWVEGNPVTLLTSDGGQNWLPDSQSLATQCVDIVFPDGQFGWKVGEYLRPAKIMVSTDGGWHWADQPPGITNTLRAVDFIGRRKGWIAGDGGVILHTDNGGGAVGVEEEREQGSKGEREKGEKLTAYPNPSRKEIRLRIRVTEASLKSTESKLRIYDLSGRLIRDLTQNLRQGHQEDVIWDGRDEKGKEMPSGTYWVKLRFGNQEQSRKVVVVR